MSVSDRAATNEGVTLSRRGAEAQRRFFRQDLKDFQDFRQLRFGEEKWLDLNCNPSNPGISPRRSEAVGNPVKKPFCVFCGFCGSKLLKL
jgi:hypothetical protein